AALIRFRNRLDVVPADFSFKQQGKQSDDDPCEQYEEDDAAQGEPEAVDHLVEEVHLLQIHRSITPFRNNVIYDERGACLWVRVPVRVIFRWRLSRAVQLAKGSAFHYSGNRSYPVQAQEERMEIGRRIRLLRKQQQRTQNDIAARCGFTVSLLS